MKGFVNFVTAYKCMKKKIIVFCFLASVFTLSAQENLVFSPISSIDGLSDNRVRTINQLSDGRVVVVTEGMVNLFNGVSFGYMHYDDRHAYGLADYSGWHHVYIDSEKRLWLKNQHKLFLFDLGKELFLPDLDELFRSQGVENRVDDLFMDSEKNFWYVTSNNELFYKSVDSEMAELFLRSILNNGSTNDPMFDLAVVDTRLYLFFRSGLMICYDRETREKLYSKNPFDNGNRYNSTLLVVPFKNFLYQVRNGINSGLLSRYDTQTGEWVHILQTDYWQNTLTLDDKGNCWISSFSGLWMIDGELKGKRLISPLHLVDGRVIETEISTQYNDKDGGLWVGTVDRGVLYYHPDRFKFRNYGRSLFNLPDAKKISVRCFAQLKNDILVGTQNGLFIRKAGMLALEQSKAVPVNTICESFYTDSQGRVWLCTQNNGVYLFDQDKIRRFEFNIGCFGLFELSDSIFLLCSGNGIGRFNSSTGRYERIPGYQANEIGHAYQISKFSGDTLIGYSDNGLFLYNYQTDKITFPAKESVLSQHSRHQYHCLFYDSRGLLWLGTMDGLSVYNPTEGTIVNLSYKEGMMNSSVRSITEDDQGRIWVSTSNGILRIEIGMKKTPNSYSFYNYNLYDGLIETEFLPRSVLRTTKKTILWGGLDGFNEIDLDRIYVPGNQLPAPLITRFLLSGMQIEQDTGYDGNVILRESVSSTSEIRLKYFQNFPGFDFSALNYVNPTQTVYRYILEGAESVWREITTTDGVGHASYTNLPPGNYTFKVSAADNSRIWGNQYTSISVIIEPPLWKTPFAYIIYIVLLLGLLYYCLVKVTRYHKKRLERLQKRDLEQMKYSFFTNVSHELRTPLTLIMTPLDSILKRLDDGPLKRQLSGVYRNAGELLGMVNQLLDFRKLEMKKETLELSYCNVCDFLRMMSVSFQEMAINNGIDLVTEYFDDNIYAYVDRDKLRKIVGNLLSNAMKFSSSGRTVWINVQRDISAGNIIIQVQDNGIGIAETEAVNIFERYYQVKGQTVANTGSGIGLHLVKEYVSLHNGSISVNSVLGKGSTFKVVIPDHLQPEKSDAHNTVMVESGESPRDKILVVEDNSEFRTFLCEELSEFYNVIVASDGKEGFEKALNHQPDLVITDIMMPGISGTELCGKMRSEIRVSHIPVILLTARTSDNAQIECYEAGADAFITKPFNMEILMLRIKSLLEKQEKQRKLFKNAIILNPESFTSNNVDMSLIQDALKYIECNLGNLSYSVEQLSKDLCMDRTGLYRKLLAVLGQTPSEFIRSVRLKRGAQLLEQGLPVAEVANMVGFGTTSYFTKSFQDEFGVKPSRYTKC